MTGDHPSETRAGIADRAWQLAYRAAYAGLRLWWWLARPQTHGALIAIWHDGELLLVRNSYRRALSLPGGFIRRDEEPATAALRELREELALALDLRQLRLAWRGRRVIDHRTDNVLVFEATLAQRPAPRADNREVVWYGWHGARQALAADLAPHVRDYLEHRTGTPPAP